jgi:RNA polymerase sigma-70 factor (ECF subfamily)
MTSDGELVRQALAGRTEAYAELVRRWAARVTALCHAKVRRVDVTDDLAQEALLRGYQSLPSLVVPEKFGPWLLGIAYRTCQDWLKSKQRQQVPFSAIGMERDAEDLSSRDQTDDGANDDMAQLLAEIEALPSDCRQVVMLYYYQDVTYKDLAQLLGVSPATINARLTKARALLRERLTSYRSPP